MAQHSSIPDRAAETLGLVQRAAAICLDHKAVEPVLLSLRGVSDMTDFFIIASGTSDTHVRALGESVMAFGTPSKKLAMALPPVLAIEPPLPFELVCR